MRAQDWILSIAVVLVLRLLFLELRWLWRSPGPR